MRPVPHLACIALASLVALYSTITSAHTKTDVVTVDNGDTITGAIDSMSAGKLALNTDYAGVIKIKWREVQQIDSRYVYEVRLDDGERLYGRFAKTEERSVLTFKVRGGQRQLDLEDIVEIRSIEEQLVDQLDLKVTSTIYADPNAVTLSLSTSGTYDTRGGRTGFSGRIDDNQTKALNAEGDTVKNTLNSSNFTLYREFWRSRGAAQSYISMPRDCTSCRSVALSGASSGFARTRCDSAIIFLSKLIVFSSSRISNVRRRSGESGSGIA